MLSARFLSLIVLSLACAPVCLADVSLIIPGFDPQPLSADIVGVGADGKTTYEIFPGQPTGTWSSDDVPTFGTVTLIEGASNAVLEYANSVVSVSESCALTSGLANCVVVFPGQTTMTAQETETPLLVEGGSTASAGSSTHTTTSSPSSPAPAQTSSIAGSSVAGSSTVAGSATATHSTATPSGTTSSGARLTPGNVAALVAMLAIWTVLA